MDIEQVDNDPILSALYGALNLQLAVRQYSNKLDKGPVKLDGDYHFDRIREAIRVREAELNKQA